MTRNQLIILILFCILSYLIWRTHVEMFTIADPVLDELCGILSKLHPKLEGIRVFPSNKSETINKKYVYICCKDENGRYYQKNTLVYVILHEFAHVLCENTGHTERFNEIFQHLLIQAEQMGMYDSSQPIQNGYCGYT